MKTLFEEAIDGVNELIQIRTRMGSIYAQLENSKNATAMQFKIKNYVKWLDTLKDLNAKKTTVKSTAEIKALKLSPSLEAKIIELFENGEITDIDIAKADLANLEKQIDTAPDNLTSSTISAANSECASPVLGDDVVMVPHVVEKSIGKKTKEIKGKVKKCEKVGDATMADGVEIDTSKIEAVPKILADIKRPTDAIGAAAYDLRFVHGIGEKNAEKMAKDGLTLALLMEDWNEWIKKDSNNAILMYSKMPIPTVYGKRQWELMDEGRQHGIQRAELENRLKRETKYLHKLLPTQLLGLKYFHDMSQKIPREEVEKIESILKKVAQRMNPDIKVMLCGSYRRGRPRSGDIDCLITHPDIKTKEDLEIAHTNILSQFVKVLTNVGFIIDHLTDFGKSKYMGFCLLNLQGSSKNTARRIDIKFIPYNSFGAAVLYFTGSKTFNTMMRTFAITKGYKLNEYGLVRTADGEFIPCPDEMDAFTLLGYPYKKPEDRDI